MSASPSTARKLLKTAAAESPRERQRRLLGQAIVGREPPLEETGTQKPDKSGAWLAGVIAQIIPPAAATTDCGPIPQLFQLDQDITRILQTFAPDTWGRSGKPLVAILRAARSEIRARSKDDR